MPLLHPDERTLFVDVHPDERTLFVDVQHPGEESGPADSNAADQSPLITSFWPRRVSGQAGRAGEVSVKLRPSAASA